MNETLQFLQQRNSAPRLCEPAPTEAELKQFFTAAVRVPDHAWLRPWRFVTIRGERRNALGALLAEALQDRNPDADEAAIAKAMAAPLRAPLLIVVVTKTCSHPKVPLVEQRQSAGCAAHAILLAAESCGYAGVWRTGDAAFDPKVMAGLGLADNEEITGFLYIGSRDGKPKNLPQLDVDAFVSQW